MEDLDPAREVFGASAHILQTLEAFGFQWDRPVLYQSKRVDAYTSALVTLRNLKQTYPCRCTRKQLAQSAPRGPGGGSIYPGTCRYEAHVPPPCVIRVKVGSQHIAFDDKFQGHYQQQLNTEVGDFIVRRRDQLCAYQLAVVIDDAAQGITDVVRGSDLLSSTPRQIHLQRLLRLTQPKYAHIPVIINTIGHKLSKQTHASALNTATPLPELLLAASYLGQNPPNHLKTVTTFWSWAMQYWNPQHIPKQISIPEVP